MPPGASVIIAGVILLLAVAWSVGVYFARARARFIETAQKTVNEGRSTAGTRTRRAARRRARAPQRARGFGAVVGANVFSDLSERAAPLPASAMPCRASSNHEERQWSRINAGSTAPPASLAVSLREVQICEVRRLTQK